MELSKSSFFLPVFQMESKPLTSEAIALAEKKMDMTLGMHINSLMLELTFLVQFFITFT